MKDLLQQLFHSWFCSSVAGMYLPGLCMAVVTKLTFFRLLRLGEWKPSAF